MGSRYVLIEFDDKDSAAKLKKQVDEASRRGRPMRVVGYFAKADGPYCVCGQDIEERTRPSTLKRQPRTGWLKCETCGLYSSMNGPRNLLGVDKIINAPRFIARHYRTKQAMEFVHHFLSIQSVHFAAPTKEKKHG